MKKFGQLANDTAIKKTISALKENGIETFVVKDREEAKKKVLDLIPKGSEVFTMSSTTLIETSIDKEINESGNFNPVRDKLYAMDRNTQAQEMNRLGAAPQYAIGSVHAVTQDGKTLIASNSGSQLPAYAYSAGKVIWVVGTQKIVKDMEEGIQRIYEHSLPLEEKRAQKAYGVGSNVSKLLIVNKENIPGRITLIFVKEKLGF